MILLLSTIIVSFLLATTMTGMMRVYAIRKKILDIPVDRSSHTIPTPRGGGVAIVIAFCILLVIASVFGFVSLNTSLALLVPGILTALVGFLDDHGHIRAGVRLIFHFLSAGSALFFLSGFPGIVIAGHEIQLGWAGILFGLFYLVWMLNLYNFMDGINGIAGSQAVTFGLSSLLILSLSMHANLTLGTGLCFALLTGASAGFLLWNYPKAKIFMGDAGSGFLGITIGVLVLIVTRDNNRLFFAEMILLGVFIVDATLTLVRRIMRGKKPYEAHASHAYQILSRRFGSHTPVTAASILISVFWLLPFALAVVADKIDGLLALVIAWAPLTIIAWYCGAGVKDKA
ncbi:MraY family glycosyltransferase [Pantoea ananatis]|uniref:MraY family glycosyltransferase n=1 Tax=Pantoea ananas TaxID=553 RepID=UPI002D77F5A6|nr:glycosyltransferase family 4 protein [Pantoea ananatis]